MSAVLPDTNAFAMVLGSTGTPSIAVVALQEELLLLSAETTFDALGLPRLRD